MGLLCDIISKLSARQRDTNENVKKKFQKVEKFLLTMSFESAIMCFQPWEKRWHRTLKIKQRLKKKETLKFLERGIEEVLLSTNSKAAENASEEIKSKKAL